MKLDVNALQILREAESEIGLFPCAGTCWPYATSCCDTSTNTGPG